MTLVPALPKWSDRLADFEALHRAALAAADPAAAVGAALAETSEGIGPLEPNLRFIAVGKASLRMAAAALAHLGPRVSAGLVIHPHGAEVPSEAELWPASVRPMAASHPLPDESSVAAGCAARDLALASRAGEALLVLLSGGASALMELPLDGLPLAALRDVTRSLQLAGADIEELNTVRRSLSQLKGGGLARLAHPARVVTLALSDVVGDRPEAIGSGPTVPSPTGGTEALEVLDRYGSYDLTGCALARGALAAAPCIPAGAGGVYRVIASNRLAAEAASREAELRGFRSLVVTTHLRGEAREVGAVVGGCAASARHDEVPLAAPACLIFGGETTVTVRGHGRGGRNQELALGAALALSGCRDVAVLSFATDGIDGPTTAAGAMATGDTVARGAARGLSARQALADNDSEAFFGGLGDLWISGLTGTNVNDLAIALIYP